MKKKDKSVQNNLQETITKALLDALKIPSPPKGLCPVDYPFLPLQYPTLQDESKKPSARIYCSRKLYKDTQYCYWHIKDKNKYLPEEISNYFGENITLKQAIEREVAKRNPLGAAYLVDADLGSNYQGKGCNLQGGYFMSANFSGAKLSNSNLNGAIFSLANLEYAYLSACNIDNTIFHGAKLFNTKFRNMNFNTYNSLKKDNFRSEKWGFFPIYRMLEDYPDQCEEMYRKLASYFADQGLFDDASWASFRAATQKLASGDLSVRVGPSLGNRRDESAELGRDFDRMAERIGDLLASQRRLLRDISHELRSPLARLNVALELARRKPEDPQGPLDRMEREAVRLNDLIGELLTLAQLDSDAQGIKRVPVDLQLLVREIVEDADFEAKVANRRVRMVQDEPVAVAGAPELLRRAIENVVRNGVRFTSDGSAVEVRLSRSEGISGPVVRISVRDHGPGVPEESLAKLFEPFYRVADARDRQSGGTGIGLAITQRAIKLHGGTVRAFNTLGGGMDVVLDLPS